MDENNNVAINIENLSKSFKDVEALKNLSMTVRKHSIFGFLGPNGAGKTTTIKLLLGLVRPTSGGATVFGHDIVSESIDIRRRVGYLAQNPHYYDHMSARETLRFTARFFYTGPKSELESRVAETLELVGLLDKADRPIRHFSGGELQRLGIAQAQVNYPDLIILDEPAASLDPMGRRDVLAVMERLREHTTIFYSTHILDDVQRVSDTVAILNHGELIAHAPIGELLASDDDVVYSVALKGNPQRVQAFIAKQEWVAGIEVTPGKEQVVWNVSVTNQQAAESELLRLVLADESTTVTEFKLKQYNLEEVFLGIIEGENNG